MNYSEEKKILCINGYNRMKKRGFKGRELKDMFNMAFDVPMRTLYNWLDKQKQKEIEKEQNKIKLEQIKKELIEKEKLKNLLVISNTTIIENKVNNKIKELNDEIEKKKADEKKKIEEKKEKKKNNAIEKKTNEIFITNNKIDKDNLKINTFNNLNNEKKHI